MRHELTEIIEKNTLKNAKKRRALFTIFCQLCWFPVCGIISVCHLEKTNSGALGHFDSFLRKCSKMVQTFVGSGQFYKICFSKMGHKTQCMKFIGFIGVGSSLSLSGYIHRAIPDDRNLHICSQYEWGQNNWSKLVRYRSKIMMWYMLNFIVHKI